MTIKPTTIEEVQKVAAIAAASNAFGKISRELAAVAIMTGSELGLGPMASLRGFHVMNGKLVASAGLITGQAFSHAKCEYFSCLEASDKRVTYETKRTGSDPSRRTYTIEDAQRAGLTRNPTWKRYPQAMLQARCASSLAREVYPDAVSGLLGDDDTAEPEQSKGAQWQEPHPAADPRHLDPIVKTMNPSTFKVEPAVWQKAKSDDHELRASAAASFMKQIKQVWKSAGIRSDARREIAHAWKLTVQTLVECKAFEDSGDAQKSLKEASSHHKGDGDLTREVIALAFAGVLVATPEPAREVA